MNANEVKAALKIRAEDFARFLFPAGRMNGGEWQVGSLRGEAGRSLSIRVSGTKTGVFKDFATDEGGDNLIELFAQARQVAFRDALHACVKWLGGPVTANCRTAPPSAHDSRSHCAARSVGVEPSSTRLSAVPDAVRAAWREGVNYALEHPDVADSLADFRGWSAAFAHYIVGCGAVSKPRHKDKRGLAFLVVAPEGERGRMRTRDVGYHIRLKPNAGEKASWRFMPNEGEHGHSIPALPFILGDFDSANLLVIAEGQWDVLTFALAARWLGDECLWPDGVGLIGIRGASGVDTFLQWYRRFWPHAANCLVLADADPAGSRWYSGDCSFTAKLSALCRKVAVVDCAPYKDFNELYRHENVGPEEVRQLLASHGMAIESEVLA